MTTLSLETETYLSIVINGTSIINCFNMILIISDQVIFIFYNFMCIHDPYSPAVSSTCHPLPHPIFKTFTPWLPSLDPDGFVQETHRKRENESNSRANSLYDFVLI